MNPFSLHDIVRLALMEDIGPGDLTSLFTVPGDIQGRANFVARESLTLSGLKAAAETLRQVDPKINFVPIADDGDKISAGDTIAIVEGSARSILSGERVALNFLLRLSGVATITAKYVQAANNPHVAVVDTRKTTPGLRILEKTAVRHGGGKNHRLALYDGILIKDNHIAACGSIEAAVNNARKSAPHTLKIEVEVDNLQQLEQALKAGADIVLLDNMPPEILRQAVTICQKFYAPLPRRTLLEASGGINLSTIEGIAQTGIDFISVGALTHSAPAVDIGLDWNY